MADKISTIVLKVDLECERCYKKIRRVLCKIQDSMNIKTISFDEKSNAVTISGPFDAEKVCKKLCCKAGRIIKEMDIKDKAKGGDKPKDGGGDKPKAAAKPAEGKPEKPKEGKAEKDGAAKGEKKDDKAEKKDGKGEKEAKPDKGGNDGKAEKKVKFADGADAKPGKAMAMPPADLGPLLEKMMAAKAGQEPPRGEPKPMAAPPAMVPGAAQGVAVPSIWPAPAGSVSGYGYNPGYDAPAYYGGGGGGYGAYGCGCGGYNGYCRCGKPAAPSGYYGVPVYDNQGWYYGGGGGGAGARQPYYQQQCCEDPNAGCSVM